MNNAFERRLWAGRRYVLTDLRIVAPPNELALDDVGDVHCSQTALQRIAGISTIDVRSKDPRRTGIVLPNIRRGAQLAALIELLATDIPARRDADAAKATMSWEPRVSTPGKREALTAMAVVFVGVIAIVVGLHGRTPGVSYPKDDAIYPQGQKRSRADIVRFMQESVMPWARQAFAPIVGSAENVTCETCHSVDAESAGWRMPAVAALPRPVVREAGWENYGGPMDAQMRNAIYGYSAESDKTSRAGYMREVVMPGMARLLRRPVYDFTRPYEYNREQFAFGCYHCHRVK
ncbi:MAG TPA: PH domain-containing protein [Vicinamibacterales bacterium]|nr:PH domain-containing protein [Vicinamibacterales bacterium]